MAHVVIIPKLGLTMTHGQVTAWLIQQGEPVVAGEPLFELMTDKITTEIESPGDGYLLKILLPAGTEAEVLTPACVVGALDEDYSAPMTWTETGTYPTADGPPVNSAASAVAFPFPAPPTIRISPLARRIAEERGVNVNALRGTGPDGRITKDDIMAASAGSQASLPTVARRVPLAGMRRIIAERLARSKREIPHAYFKITVEAGNLQALRENAAPGRRPSFNDLLIKAAAKALTEFPGVNASLDGQEIIQHSEVNIGLAVSVQDGVVVPVIARADRKSLAEVAEETMVLIEKARSGRLNQEDISGGNFTVTNLGMYGLDDFTAVINPPESAILAAGAIVERPWAREGRIIIAPVISLTLSVDHRIIDGALAAQFLARLKQLLEAPAALA